MEPIKAVSTSIAAFVGPTSAGSSERASEPLTSLPEFERDYGDSTMLAYADHTRAPNFMWQAARAFFANGGRRLLVARVWRADDRPPGAADYAAALERLEDPSDIAIIAAPGSTFGYQHGRMADADGIVRALLSHAERMRYRFAIVDSGDGQSPADVRAMRASLDSTHGGLYYPWVRVADPAGEGDLLLPPSGFVAGIYARVDLDRGVHKAPANEALVLATGLERDLPAPAEADLNAVGINCLRRLSGLSTRRGTGLPARVRSSRHF